MPRWRILACSPQARPAQHSTSPPTYLHPSLSVSAATELFALSVYPDFTHWALHWLLFWKKKMLQMCKLPCKIADVVKSELAWHRVDMTVNNAAVVWPAALLDLLWILSTPVRLWLAVGACVSVCCTGVVSAFVSMRHPGEFNKKDGGVKNQLLRPSPSTPTGIHLAVQCSVTPHGKALMDSPSILPFLLSFYVSLLRPPASICLPSASSF